jgi:hypothetical protein
MKKLAVITLFAIAMGYLESAVVVYLREIFYPEGFAFPIRTMMGNIATTEVIREFATLVMLASIGYLGGKNRMQRFGIFLYAFGIWDIFYYLFLKFLIGWPESLFTWDILFMIPVTWVGPVLAPVINALTMCVLGAFIYHSEENEKRVKLRRVEWALLIIGSMIVLISYTQDYLHYIAGLMPLMDLFKPSEADKILIAVESYVPENFNWWLFAAGQSLLVLALALVFNRRVNWSAN